jgi:hypothetical protein
VVVSNEVILSPGQSAIFVSSMEADAFRRWWGEENLPADLPIITHHGNGLSTFGDSMRLWNATAMDVDDYVVSAAVLDTNVTPTEGVSLEFDEIFRDLSIPSVEGERGAFRAAEGDDIGSPGWTSNEQRVVRPRVTLIHRIGPGVTVTWKTQPGRTYELRYRDDLAGPDWLLVVSQPAIGDSLTVTDTTAGAAAQRFYKVFLVP